MLLEVLAELSSAQLASRHSRQTFVDFVEKLLHGTSTYADCREPTPLSPACLLACSLTHSLTHSLSLSPHYEAQGAPSPAPRARARTCGSWQVFSSTQGGLRPQWLGCTRTGRGMKRRRPARFLLTFDTQHTSNQSAILKTATRSWKRQHQASILLAAGLFWGRRKSFHRHPAVCKQVPKSSQGQRKVELTPSISPEFMYQQLPQDGVLKRN